MITRRRAAGVAVPAALTAAGAGVAALARWATRPLLDPDAQAPDADLLVVDASPAEVALERTERAAWPGTYALRWPGGHVQVGPVTTVSAHLVTRPVLAGSPPLAGTRCWPDPAVWRRPADCLRPPVHEVSVAGELGDYPAWYVPGSGDTWVVAVHGHRGDRTRALRLARDVQSCGRPVLVTSWRNDGDAPASADGLYHLGATEWRDVDAAVGWARQQGAVRIVLAGLSTGGAIVTELLRYSAHRRSVAALILDAPVLSWPSLLRAQAAERHLPAQAAALTRAETRRRIGVDPARVGALDRGVGPGRPTLLLHGDADEVVPVEDSRRWAQRHAPDVTYVEVPDAAHECAWNADPERYAAAVRAFLARL